MMHISDGILGLPLCAGGFAAAALMTGIGSYKLEKDEIPKIAVMGAAFFVSSLIHFKIGFSSIHLTLTGIMALVLGYRSILAVITGLFFQAVMFHHGGLSTLGVNAVVTGLPAMITAILISLFLKNKKNTFYSLGASGAAFLTTFLSALLAWGILSLSGNGFSGVAAIFSLSHLILAGIETVITFFVIRQILIVKPGMLFVPPGKEAAPGSDPAPGKTQVLESVE